MAPVQAPPRSPEQQELEALIEEARRRARRRRLGYVALVAAATLVAAGIYVGIGGGGGNGIPVGAPSNRPGAAAASGSSPSPAATGYRCPTSIRTLKRSGRGNGIPSCSIRFFATLPAGWHQGAKRVSVLPPRLASRIPGGSPIVSVVSFANFPLSTTGLSAPIWPIPTPADGIVIGIFPEAPASGAKAASAGVVNLQPGDFKMVRVQRNEPLADTELYTGGWRFRVEVRVGTDGPQSESVDQANAVLSSIETTQHLCPCGWG